MTAASTHQVSARKEGGAGEGAQWVYGFYWWVTSILCQSEALCTQDTKVLQGLCCGYNLLETAWLCGSHRRATCAGAAITSPHNPSQNIWPFSTRKYGKRSPMEIKNTLAESITPENRKPQARLSETLKERKRRHWPNILRAANYIWLCQSKTLVCIVAYIMSSIWPGEHTLHRPPVRRRQSSNWCKELQYSNQSHLLLHWL